MAEKAGYGGFFQYDATAGSTPTTVLKGINNWTVNYNADALEATNFTDSGTRTYIGGQTGWTGTITGFYDTSSTVVYNSTIAPGNTIEVEFTMAAGHDMEGDAVVTGMSYTTGVDGAVTVSLDLQGNGALAIT